MNAFLFSGVRAAKLTVPNELLGRPVVVSRLYCEYNLPSDICFFTLTSNISHTSSDTLIPFFSIEVNALIIVLL